MNSKEMIVEDQSQDQEQSRNPGDVIETIRIPEHGGPSDIRKAISQISRVANALAGRVLLAGGFGGGGAAHPVMQSVIQCAAGAGQAAAVLEQMEKQQLGLVGAQMVPRDRMGRA